ncbi:MAG: sigma 54-interacting transcriptional regulator [Colwellia sp.]
MERILVAWIGGLDIDEGLLGKSGPVHATLDFSAFTQAHLLYNYAAKDKDASSYVSWLKKQPVAKNTRLKSYYTPLTTPQDFGEIYQASEKLLASIQKQNPKAKITLQITPGTPAMQAVWILLGKTKFQVEFLQSSREQGVQPVNIPFEISAELQTGQKLKDLAQASVPTHAAFENIITQNEAMLLLKQRATVLAQHDVPVLINGDSGTGKELFATAIHNASKRANGPLKVVNCGAIPPELIDSTLFGYKKGAFTGAASDQQGVFEAANGGTLFLDEFGELPLDAQVRLLRVLQEGTLNRVGDSKEVKVDVRIICATNKDLIHMIADGQFREDLFYRIAVGVINLPPIKDRKGDITLLAKTLLKQIQEQLDLNGADSKGKKLSPKANNLIQEHSWPGNVRELYSTLLRACLWSKNNTINDAELKEAMFTQPPNSTDIMSYDLSQPVDLKELIDNVESYYVKLAWQKSAGKKKKAAELLGYSSYQNYNKRLEKHGIN